MATATIDRALGHRVSEQIRIAGLTVKETAERAGIKYVDLLLKIDGSKPFTTSETIKIANAIGVQASALIVDDANAVAA